MTITVVHSGATTTYSISAGDDRTLTIDDSDTVTLQAVRAVGYRFSAWRSLQGNISTDNPYTINSTLISQLPLINCVFETATADGLLTPYVQSSTGSALGTAVSVSLSWNLPGASGSRSYSLPANQTAVGGSSVANIWTGLSGTITVACNTSGYEVKQISWEGSSIATSAGTYSVVPTSTIQSLLRIYVGPTASPTTYTITASGNTGGSVSPGGTIYVDEGDDQTFTATPSTGYEFSYWLIDGSALVTDSTYTFYNVTANHTIQPVFARTTYTVRVYRSGWPYVGSYGDHSSSATYIDVSGAAGETYDVCWSQWSGDDTKNICDYGSNTQYGGEDFDRITFGTTSSPVYPGKRYSALTKTITASAGSGGTISPSGAVQVNYGASKTFTVSANPGYKIEQILIDGSPITL